MIDKIPGTMLEFNQLIAEDCFSAISPLLTITKGLTLSQVSEVTGLEPSTIQNWVKRGWVKKPEGKRYGEEQLMRIILINMMRGSMQLDQITFLMSYINGSVEDRSDDILPDKELFNILCSAIYQCDNDSIYDTDKLDSIIDKSIEKAVLNDEVSIKKLKKALRTMVLAILSTRMRELSQKAFAEIN